MHSRRDCLKVSIIISISTIHGFSPLSVTAGFSPHLQVWPFRKGMNTFTLAFKTMISLRSSALTFCLTPRPLGYCCSPVKLFSRVYAVMITVGDLPLEINSNFSNNVSLISDRGRQKHLPAEMKTVAS